jgi:hypothetical protein
VMTADGLWRKRRGIDDATAASVESELKALMSIPQPPTNPIPAAPLTPIVSVAAPIPAPVATPLPTVPPAPSTPATPDVQSFVKFLSKASLAIGAKKLTQDELNSAAAVVGVPQINLLANRLDLLPQVEATIDAIIASR